MRDSIPQLALQHYQKGAYQSVINLLEKSCNEGQADAVAYNLMVAAYVELGQMEKALSACDIALTRYPDSAVLHSTRGLILEKLARYQDAIDAYNNSLQIDSSHPDIYFNLGNVNTTLENFPMAKMNYQKCLDLNPGDHVACRKLAQVFHRMDENSEAELYFTKAIDLFPSDYITHYQYAALLNDLNRMDEARAQLKRTVELKPDFVNAWARLGDMHKTYYNYDVAARYYRQAMEITQNEPGIRLKYAECLLKNKMNPDLLQNNFNEALSVYQAILSENPANIRAAIGLANAFRKTGQYRKAMDIIDNLTNAHNMNADVLTAYASLSKRFEKTEHAIHLIRLYLDSGECPDNERRQLLFSLGDLYDSSRQYADAFDTYLQANQLSGNNPRQINLADRSERIIHTLDSNIMRQLHDSAVISEAPVFIVGMPRSGTNLVEQILSQHPDVYAAGEIRDISNIVSRLRQEGISYPEDVANIPQERIDYYAHQYLDRIRSFSRNARLVTNKMPSNFLYLGLINILFPGARVINCQRNTLDTCLSCYFQPFGSILYNHELLSIAEACKHKDQLMQHWRAVLSIPILDMQYEDLVNRPQENIGTLLEFCGLNWDERCLAFHTSDRIVQSASEEQVKQPIYTTSATRWKNYAPYIQPLISFLEQSS